MNRVNIRLSAIFLLYKNAKCTKSNELVKELNKRSFFYPLSWLHCSIQHSACILKDSCRSNYFVWSTCWIDALYPFPQRDWIRMHLIDKCVSTKLLVGVNESTGNGRWSIELTSVVATQKAMEKRFLRRFLSTLC